MYIERDTLIACTFYYFQFTCRTFPPYRSPVRCVQTTQKSITTEIKRIYLFFPVNKYSSVNRRYCVVLDALVYGETTRMILNFKHY